MTCHSQMMGGKTVDDMAQTCWDDEWQHEGVPLSSQPYNDDDGAREDRKEQRQRIMEIGTKDSNIGRGIQMTVMEDDRQSFSSHGSSLSLCHCSFQLGLKTGC